MKLKLSDVQLFETEKGYIPFIYNYTKTHIVLLFKNIKLELGQDINEVLSKTIGLNGCVVKNPYAAYYKHYYLHKGMLQFLSQFSSESVHGAFYEKVVTYEQLKRYIKTINKYAKKEKDLNLNKQQKVQVEK